VVLPTKDIEFIPTGESPLTRHEEFLDAKCPMCGKTSRRETDTMDTFIDSSWYQYAYLDRYNNDAPINRELTKKWLPVDQYTGGVEHATMHLLYTRFWTKVMRDIGLIEFDEPMTRLFNQGTIESGGMKMSKSRGNVVAPDTYVEKMGADTVRLYLMFMGPWNEGGDWNDKGVGGVYRWLNRVWTLVTETSSQSSVVSNQTNGAAKELQRKTHQTIKRVTVDMDAFKFNTMVAAMMEFTNYLQKARKTDAVKSPAWREAIESFLMMLAPSTPHFSEELWQKIGKPYSIHQQEWPKWDPKIAAEETFTIVVQVNGKVRDRLEFPVGAAEAEVKDAALQSENVKRHLDGAAPRRVIFVPGKLVNIVK
jgi:leucyl-tRNA synthetase